MDHSTRQREVLNFLDVAPQDETARSDYFVRLLTLLSFKVPKADMEEAIWRALNKKVGR